MTDEHGSPDERIHRHVRAAIDARPRTSTATIHEVARDHRRRRNRRLRRVISLAVVATFTIGATIALSILLDRSSSPMASRDPRTPVTVSGCDLAGDVLGEPIAQTDSMLALTNFAPDSNPEFVRIASPPSNAPDASSALIIDDLGDAYVAAAQAAANAPDQQRIVVRRCLPIARLTALKDGLDRAIATGGPQPPSRVSTPSTIAPVTITIDPDRGVIVIHGSPADAATLLRRAGIAPRGVVIE